MKTQSFSTSVYNFYLISYSSRSISIDNVLSSYALVLSISAIKVMISSKWDYYFSYFFVRSLIYYFYVFTVYSNV